MTKASHLKNTSTQSHPKPKAESTNYTTSPTNTMALTYLKFSSAHSLNTSTQQPYQQPDNTLRIWETCQTKYIRKILQLPNISNENTLKFGNLTTIRTRINDLTLKWYKNLFNHNNTPIIDFIRTTTNSTNLTHHKKN